MKQRPIAEILRCIRPLNKELQATQLRGHIASEQCGNIRKTSVRIRELQAALQDVQTRRLKREGRAA